MISGLGNDSTSTGESTFHCENILIKKAAKKSHCGNIKLKEKRKKEKKIRKNLFFFFSFSFFLIFSPMVSAETASSIRSFGDSLYQEKDYYRAITEYKRFLYLYPNHPQRNDVQFHIGFSYLKGEKWDAAIPYFQKLETPEAFFTLGQTYFEAKRYTLAIDAWNQFLEQYPKSYLTEWVRYQLGWAYFFQEKLQPSSQVFSQIKNLSLKDKAQKLSREIISWNEKPYRSPFLAGTLSAILPGLGQWYDGRFWDGLSALLVNGMFAYGIYATFRDEHYPSAGILIFLGSGFYGGNIFSAVSSAHKFNQNIRESSWSKLKNQYGIEVDWTGTQLKFSF